MNKKRKLHLEALRIIAIYFVILTHTGKRGFTFFTTLEPSVGYFLAMGIPLLCNICVPLFYMISGATMLSKDETPGQIWKRRIPKYLTVLVLATLAMYCYYGLKDEKSLCVGDFLLTLYSKNVIAPYWYLYSYLGFLVLLPFLRKMIRTLTDREFLYLFALHLVVSGLIPMGQYWLSEGQVYLNGSLNVSIVTMTIVIFPAAGYYFERKELSWKKICLLWLLTVASMAAAVWLTHYKICLTGQMKESQVGTFYKSLCLIPSVTVYATVKKLFDTHPVSGWLEKGILSVGSCTFGIYLIEQILRERGYAVQEWLAQWLTEIPATLIYVGLIAAAGYGIVWLLKRIPIVKKLI
jgi:surface polysaccharide O-acyltransferase-like enzyme